MLKVIIAEEHYNKNIPLDKLAATLNVSVDSLESAKAEMLEDVKESSIKAFYKGLKAGERLVPVAADIPCRKDSIAVFSDTNSISRCTLSRDHVIQGILFRADSIVGFNENGRLWRCNISLETIISEHTLQGKKRG